MCAIEMQLILDTFILFVFVFGFSQFRFFSSLFSSFIKWYHRFHTYLYRRCINFNLTVQCLKCNVICFYSFFYLIFHNPYFTNFHRIAGDGLLQCTFAIFAARSNGKIHNSRRWKRIYLCLGNSMWRVYSIW